MDSFHYEQFFGGLIIGLALRSTDLLPVAVGGVIGYYVGIKNINLLNTVKGLSEKYISKIDKNISTSNDD